MSADKVQEAHDALVSEILDEMSGGPPGRPTRWGRMIDDLIAAVREDERERAVARVMELPTENWTESGALGRMFTKAAVEAIRNA